MMSARHDRLRCPNLPFSYRALLFFKEAQRQSDIPILLGILLGILLAMTISLSGYSKPRVNGYHATSRCPQSEHRLALDVDASIIRACGQRYALIDNTRIL